MHTNCPHLDLGFKCGFMLSMQGLKKAFHTIDILTKTKPINPNYCRSYTYRVVSANILSVWADMK